MNVVIEHGTLSPSLKRMVMIADAPARLFPFGPKQLRHEISPETAQKICKYLEKNDLTDVYVCVNQYDPVGEWERLKANRRISPIWRYTFGTLSIIAYTIVPDPVVCRTQYNPFTNRLSVNVDEPVIALHEAAYAKDVHSQSMPGTYVAVTSLPGFSLVRTIHGISDVVGYAQAENDWETEKGAYRHLYPRVGAEGVIVGVFLLPVWWEQVLLGVGSSAAGCLTGRVLELQREKEMLALQDTTELQAESQDRTMPLLTDE